MHNSNLNSYLHLYLYIVCRFAQFFVAPLFKTDSSEREVMAVDAEYKNALQDDDARLNFLVQSLAKSGLDTHTHGLDGAIGSHCAI